MDWEKMPSRPVIPSHWAAQAMADAWLRENVDPMISDGDGLRWSLNIRTSEPTKNMGGHRVKMLLQVSLALSAEVGCDELIRTGTLDPDKDQRLIQLLGEKKISFCLKPIIFTASSRDEARQIFLAEKEKLIYRMQKSSLHAVKRQLMTRHIESATLFQSCENRL